MAIDPHTAFRTLIQAWEEFHAAVVDTEDGDAPRVLRAADRLADAYTVYDDVLFTTYGVEAPFDTFDDDIDDDEYDDDFDDDIDGIDDDDDEYDDDFDDYDDDDIDDEDTDD